MEIKIEIENKGCLIGTIGWLAKVEKKICVSETTRGNRGVWLEINDEGKKYKFALAICGIKEWEPNEIVRISLNNEKENEYYTLSTSVHFTDAAFDTILGLSQSAKEILENLDKDETLELRIA